MTLVLNNFQPLPGSTVSISATDASGRVLVRASTQPGLQGKWYSVTNADSANIAFVQVGGSTVAATLPNGATPGSEPVLPGQTISIDGSTGRYVAAICLSTKTATIYITQGHIGPTE